MQTSCSESIDVEEEKKCKRDGYYITQPFARRVNVSPLRFSFCVDQDDEENRERKKKHYMLHTTQKNLFLSSSLCVYIQCIIYLRYVIDIIRILVICA